MPGLTTINIWILSILTASKATNSYFTHSRPRCSGLVIELMAKRIRQKNIVDKIDNSEKMFREVEKAARRASPVIINGLETKGWAIIDNFFADPLITKIMRAEAVNYFEQGDMILSQSTRWDPVNKTTVVYNKHNVFSMQLNGGESYYRGPRLHEYVVGMVKSLAPVLQSRFPEAMISPTMASNKLAVCTGEGSAYDKVF